MMVVYCFFFNDTATIEIYTYLHTLSLHDALPIYAPFSSTPRRARATGSRPRSPERSLTATQRLGGSPGSRSPTSGTDRRRSTPTRSEEHTSELQSLMRISYAVFCLKKTNYY